LYFINALLIEKYKTSMIENKQGFSIRFNTDTLIKETSLKEANVMNENTMLNL